MSAGGEEGEHMPVSLPLFCALALVAEKRDTVSMDRGVFISFSKGGE